MEPNSNQPDAQLASTTPVNEAPLVVPTPPVAEASQPMPPSVAPEATPLAPSSNMGLSSSTAETSAASSTQPNLTTPATEISEPQVVAGGMPVTPFISSKKSILKPLLIAGIVLLVIGGGSAAAYLGVVVPNKPENVLKSALINSLQENQVSFKGSVDSSSAGGEGGLSVKSDFAGSVDTTNKAMDANLNMTIAGAKLPLEIRYVGKNLYFKPGDLTEIAKLANSYSPEYGAMAKAYAKALSNQWIVVDSTLLNQAGGVDCALNVDTKMTDADIKLLNDEYSKHPFTTIKSTSSDSVDGKSVTKYVLSLDDNAAAAFGNNLNNLSVVKKLESCNKNSSSSTPNAKGDGDHTPVTVWVDKASKHIVKLASESTSQDSKNGVKGSGSVTLKYEKVSITAPSNAKPALEVFSQLQQSSKPGNPKNKLPETLQTLFTN